jgi:PTS system beta-glucosides-specific IIC component
MKKELAKQIISLIGGEENITKAWHCITRLRFNLVDDKKVDLEAVKALDVMGAQFQGNQLQIIIGAEVEEVYQAVSQLLSGKSVNENKGKKGNPLEAVFDVISGVFTPILPAIVAAGLLKGVMALFVALNFMGTDNSIYTVFNIISDGAFYFLPFLVAYSAAKKFGTNESMALSLAAILMYPTFGELINAGTTSLPFIGFPITLNTYNGSVLPILLGVYLLTLVDKVVSKVIPRSIKIVFVPLLSLIITAPLMLAFIAPLGSVIGVYLERLFTTLFDVAGPFAGLLLGGIMPVIVITGMHYAFFPGAFASFEKYGFEVMLLPMNLVANLAQAGAVLGVMLRTKNKDLRSVAFSSFIPALFGITEPAIYGVTLRLKKPFYAALLGGGIGGAIYGFFNVKAFAFSVPGITSIPTYLQEGTNNFIYAILGVVASFAVAAIATFILGFKEDKVNDNNKTLAVANTQPQSKNNVIKSPLSGEIVDLKNVQDLLFAKEEIGKGTAILPMEGMVYAPFDGIIKMTTPTAHAIGLESNDGIELLIHIGLNTVDYNGEGFTYLVQEKDAVIAGQQLLQFDIDHLKELGADLTSPVIVTNTHNYLDVIGLDSKKVIANETNIIHLIK